MGEKPGSGRSSFLQLLVTVVVSAGTAMLVVLAMGSRSTLMPDRSRPTEAGITWPASDEDASSQQDHRAVEQLLKAIEAAGSPELRSAVRDRKQYEAALLDRLHGLHPEQHYVVDEVIRALARLGDAAVPGILTRLKSGDFPDAASEYASHGAEIQGASERMWLLDALRQIGTPVAQDALIATVRDSGGLSDYRDLFALYHSTQDERMIPKIGALVPGFLEKLADTGLKRATETTPSLMTYFGYWLTWHGAPGADDALARVVEEGCRSHSFEASDLFRALVRSSPERAAELMERLVKSEPGSFYALSRGLWSIRSRVQSARAIEQVIRRTELNGQQREQLYSMVPCDTSYYYGSAEEQRADLVEVRDILNHLRAAEPEEQLRKTIDQRLAQIDESLATLAKHS